MPNDVHLVSVMGVLNVTPDSFSDPGCHDSLDRALLRAQALCQQGADIIDIGGESTRPGALPVSLQQELDRIMPVLEAVQTVVDVPISLDTSKPEVMREGIRLGVNIINDVNALQAIGAVEVVAAHVAVKVCLVHKQGIPETMQNSPQYGDVVAEVSDFLAGRIEVCKQAGIDKQRLIVDPGFGFGKTHDHNLELLRKLRQLRGLGCPILVGLSRKSMIGKLLGVPVDERMLGSVVMAVLAVQQGACIVRTHDVLETQQGLRVLFDVMHGESMAT